VLRQRARFIPFVGLSLIAIAYGRELVLARLNSGFGTGTRPAWGLDQASPEQKQEIAEVAQEAGITIDVRDGVDVLDELRAQGESAVQAVGLGGIVAGDHLLPARGPAARAELMPVGGISDRVTLMCNESGQYVTYRSDQYGFRNRREVWQSPQMQVAVVGQSFVQGYCVSNGHEFAALIREQYPITANLGMSGQGPLLQVAAISEYLQRHVPQFVIWAYCEDIDLGNLRQEATHRLLMQYLAPSFGQHLLSRQGEIDAALEAYEGREEQRERQLTYPSPKLIDTLEATLKLWNLREALNLSYGFSTGHISNLEPDDATIDLFASALGRANTMTKSWGGKLYFVYLPSWNRFKNGPTRPNHQRAAVLARAASLDIPIIDLAAIFERSDDPLSLFMYRRFGHYNDNGNTIVADAVLNVISRRADHH
jgi:hypothetical protein